MQGCSLFVLKASGCCQLKRGSRRLCGGGQSIPFGLSQICWLLRLGFGSGTSTAKAKVAHIQVELAFIAGPILGCRTHATELHTFFHMSSADTGPSNYGMGFHFDSGGDFVRRRSIRVHYNCSGKSFFGSRETNGRDTPQLSSRSANDRQWFRFLAGAFLQPFVATGDPLDGFVLVARAAGRQVTSGLGNATVVFHQ
jgi:hypothetical protein